MRKVTTGADRVLVDTSAWIEALRGRDARLTEIVDRLLDEERVVFCGIIEMELLHGLRKSEAEGCLALFEVLPYIEVDRQEWRRGGELLAGMRSRGSAIPATDALIAALCLRHELTLLTLDKHFNNIPQLKLLA